MRLIDADAFDKVLSDAQNECKKKSGGNFRYGFLSTVRANMLKQPTVDAAPVKHGRWAKNKHGYITCSICDSFPLAVMIGSLITMNLHYEPYESEYCPYCGAKMDLEGLDAAD